MRQYFQSELKSATVNINFVIELMFKLIVKVSS